jgi:hypothetical protein
VFGGLAGTYSVEFWFWNGLPNGTRPITGHLVAIGDRMGQPLTDFLGIGGTHIAPRRLFFAVGKSAGAALAGKTQIAPKTWHHLVLVRHGKRVTVYLDGHPEPEIAGQAEETAVKGANLFLGGRGDGVANFEGKLDEVAFYDRALDPAEIAVHFREAHAR